MPLLVEENTPLPSFRMDLKEYPGPDEKDGSPTFTLFDPFKGQYYKISWEQALILHNYRNGMTANELIQAIESKAPIKVQMDDIKNFFEDAYRFNFLNIPKPSEHLKNEAVATELSWLQWFLYSYLYFRVPVLKPDAFLTRTLPYVKPLASSLALMIYGLISLVGLIMLFTRIEEFLHTYTYFFSIQGAFWYLIGISCVKFVHEFAHAYTANYYKLHIANMGVAFIVMWPVLYTDATDAWRLSNRLHRLYISLAGVSAELVLGGICLFIWGISSPGILQSMCFVISSITLISSLIINLNPALRYDGYFLLCDIWGIDNLQARAFNMTRWWLRKKLWGLDLPIPEEGFSQKTINWLIIYTFYTWAYRLTLYLSIALFVYFLFTKTLGIALLIAEIAVFIVWPIASEIKELMRLQSHFHKNPNLFISLTVLSVLFLWLIIPLPHSERFIAITAPTEEQIVYIPQESQIQQIFVKRGSQVKKGDVLLQLASEKLNNDLAVLKIQRSILERQIYQIGLDKKYDTYLETKKQELNSVVSQLETIEEQQKRLTVLAQIDGELYAWNERLRKNLYVKREEFVGKIAPQSVKIVAFVAEDMLYSLQAGQAAKFIAKNTYNTYLARILQVSHVSANILRYPSLASVNGGPLPVVELAQKKEHESLELVESYFIVEAEITTENKEATPLSYGQQGWLEVKGPWQSYLSRFVNYVIRVVWRESGF